MMEPIHKFVSDNGKLRVTWGRKATGLTEFR